MKLIVNADDAGYSSTRDKGILYGVDRGSISDVSVLVNGESHRDFAKSWMRTRRYAPGLHVNLSEGKPVSEPRFVQSLLNSHGFMLGKMGFRNQLRDRSLSMEEVRRETRAQVRRFIDIFGDAPSHYDGHQHVHTLPGVRVAIAEEMKSFGVTMTRCPDSPSKNVTWLTEIQQKFNNSVLTDAIAARGEFLRLGIRAPSSFIGLSTMGSNMNLSRLHAELLALPSNSVCELMVHPGYKSDDGERGCGGGVDAFSMSVDRESELKFITSSDWKELLHDLKVDVVSFREAQLSDNEE